MQSKPSAVRRAPAGGFTIVEIVIVLVVIGLLAGFALPKIDIQRYRVETAMQGIGTTLLAAQRLAVTKQYDIVIMFDVANQSLRILEDADNDGVAGSTERVRGFPLGDEVVFGRASAPARPMGPGPIEFSKLVGGMPAVTFHRSGSASQEGGFYLTSKAAARTGGRESDSRALEVERATGRASWFRYNPPSWTRGF